jgi:hypothetical protein
MPVWPCSHGAAALGVHGPHAQRRIFSSARQMGHHGQALPIGKVPGPGPGHAVPRTQRLDMSQLGPRAIDQRQDHMPLTHQLLPLANAGPQPP